MNDEKKMNFYNRLTDLLNGVVKEKSEDVRKREYFCDVLKWNITKIIEEIYKLDFLSDEIDLRSFISENVDDPIERMKIQMDKPWLNDKLTIGLMGHFNSGKTTALNLIFDENFATKNRENTALATYLTYGENPDVITIVDKGGKSQIIPLSDGELFDYSKGIRNFPFARIFDYLVKDSRNKILENLTFIDTPGLSSSNEHSEPTMKAISTCDAIFWFINLTDSAAIEDVKFIETYLKEKPLYVVLSFADAVESLKASKDVVVSEFKKRNIDVKHYFILGRNSQFQTEFKQSTIKKLKELINEYEVYNPYAHLYGFVSWMENVLIDSQKALTDSNNKINKKTNEILNNYKSSENRYSSAWENCTNRINNMIETFQQRCSGAFMCGGASGAIASDLNSVIDSLKRMANSYQEIDLSQLVEYGHLTMAMSEVQSKIERASEILTEIKELKNVFN